MEIPNLIRTLSYMPLWSRTLRALGLGVVAREWYWRAAQQRHGVISVKVAGIRCQFRVRNADELRAVEKEVLGERKPLEVILSYLGPGDVVYEVGAGAGGVTLFLAKAGAKVFAFEPSTGNRTRLVENLRLNQVSSVHVFATALGECDQEIPFYDGSGRLDFSATPLPSSSMQTSRELIKLIRGDHFRVSNGLPMPRAVHIDVEGYEYAVIKGLRETLKHEHCLLVACEVHAGLLPDGMGEEDIVASLESLGFQMVQGYVSHGAHILVGRKSDFSRPPKNVTRNHEF
jgi:FkbM family methyltransferase